MRICICDDDRGIHAELLRLLRQIEPDATVCPVTHLYSGEALIDAYAKDSPFDLIFLDVEMAAATGIEAARKVREHDGDVMIVFVSSHQKYVFSTFPVSALHYLLKPIDETDFADVFRRARQRYREAHTVVHLRFNDERYTVPVCRILFVEGVRRHVYFHTQDGVLEAVGKLSDFSPLLLEYGFASPHYSFLVNMDKIQRFEKEKIVMQNGERVYCSVRRRADMLRLYDQYLGNRKW